MLFILFCKKKPLPDLKGAVAEIQNPGLDLYYLPVRITNPKWQHFPEYRMPSPQFYHL